MESTFTLENWEALVASLASPEGYSQSLCLDDYYHDIADRVRLESLDASENFRERLTKADAIFREHTLKARETRLSGQYWWHFRLPLRGGDGILEEARSCGLV